MKTRILRRLLIALSALVALDQALQYTLLRDGELLSRRIAPFDPPVFAPAQRESLARIRAHLATGTPPLTAFDFDPDLGWCPRRDTNEGLYRFDWAGSRVGTAPLARKRVAGVRRVVAIGCSFTLGMAVAGDESWSAVLDARREDLEVANLGAGAYGLDQALLRWRRDGIPLASDEVWLGLLPEATPRVLTMYAPALRHWAFSIAFKPRFHLDARDELELIPSPARSLADIDRFMRSQSAFLDAVQTYDHWVARAPIAYAPSGCRLAHHCAITRLALTVWERQGREPADLLAERHGELLPLVRAIVRTLQREVEANGAHLRVFILPNEHDLADHARRGHPYWQGLVDALVGDGAAVFDVTPALIAAGGAANHALWAGEGHMSAAGNACVAAELARQLDRSH